MTEHMSRHSQNAEPYLFNGNWIFERSTAPEISKSGHRKYTFSESYLDFEYCKAKAVGIQSKYKFLRTRLIPPQSKNFNPDQKVNVKTKKLKSGHKKSWAKTKIFIIRTKIQCSHQNICPD